MPIFFCYFAFLSAMLNGDWMVCYWLASAFVFWCWGKLLADVT